MKEVVNQLKERENLLLQIKNEKEKALLNVPEGALRICSHGNRTQYYQRMNPKDFNGTYIRGNNLQLAHDLAQKDYDTKVLKAAEKELKAIEKYFSIYPETYVEKIYEQLHDKRKELVVPIFESAEQYAKKWEAVEYQRKGFKEDVPEFYTTKGERVRSKTEVIIADLLCKNGIPYRYEYPIYLKGLGIIHPDFTVLNMRTKKEMYWEHMGMMDDPGYVEKALRKIENYEKNGFFPGDNLILTYESRKNPINQKIVKSMIEHYLI